MEFILDMVHHNPGEAPFDTRFLDPRVLASYGYNGQVYKHVNCAVTFDRLDSDIFPAGSESRAWIDSTIARIAQEVRDAKAAGLKIYYHVDLFVLPQRLIEKFRSGICDPQTGLISVDMPDTLRIHAMLFDELFATFPDIDGLIIRTGETYLFDTPYHAGNGSVRFNDPSTDRETEIRRFAKLINFLRNEICEKHQRHLIYRTWDCAPDRFHANPDYYRAVTDQITPHEKLLFSIKHTTLDFFRRCGVNPCLGIGNHRQIVEVQCQREYEGKGAFPNYVAKGVIDGFPEDGQGTGLREIAKNELIAGVFTWTRGGGWYGPYLKNEMWCDLNAYVVAGWAHAPEKTEEVLFKEFASSRGLRKGYDSFRTICLRSLDAVLGGRYCAYHDIDLVWMRDDVIGGIDQLRKDLTTLRDAGNLQKAVEEKNDAATLWEELRDQARNVEFASEIDTTFVNVSTEYARILFRIVAIGWSVMAARTSGTTLSPKLIEDYKAAWKEYLELKEHNECCPTLYRGEYWNWPGKPLTPGLTATVLSGEATS